MVLYLTNNLTLNALCDRVLVYWKRRVTSNTDINILIAELLLFFDSILRVHTVDLLVFFSY